MNALRIASVIVGASGAITLCVAFLLARSRMEIIRTWKPVQVEVIRSWMETHEAGAADERSTSYSAHYELAYTFNGESLRSTARSEDVFMSGPEQVQVRLKRHSAGTAGVAYVNPKDPSQVRLNVGKNINIVALPLWLLLAGVSLLLFGLSFWLMGTSTVRW